MPSNACIVSLISQTKRPASLIEASTTGVFCSQFDPQRLSSSKESYYPLAVQLSLSHTSEVTISLEHGDFVSRVSITAILPALVNVSVVPVSDAGVSGGSDYRAIVAKRSHRPGANDISTYLAKEDDLSTPSNAGFTEQGDSGYTGLISDLNADDNFAAHYCDYTGAQLINVVEVLLNGKIVQRVPGQWLFLFNELYRKEPQRTGIGKVSDTAADGLDYVHEVKKNKKNQTLSDTHLEIDIPLFFQTTRCAAFPRFLFLNKDAVQLRIRFNPLRSVIVNSGGIGNALNVKAGGQSTQTVTVRDNPDQTSSVYSHLMRNVAPTSSDFKVNDFTVALRVHETYVNPATLNAERNRMYRTVVPQFEIHTATTSTPSAVSLQNMSSNPRPLHSTCLYGTLLENVVTNNPFHTGASLDQLTGRYHSPAEKVMHTLGNHQYEEEPNKTLQCERTPRYTCKHVPRLYKIHVTSFSPEDPFPEGGLKAIPRGCVDMSANSSSGVEVTPCRTAFKDNSGAGGTNYSSGRGAANGNSILFTCGCLHMDMLTVQPSTATPGYPAVTMAVDESAQATRRRGGGVSQ